MLRFSIVLFVSIVALSGATPAGAAPVCGEDYRIVSGDTLSRIATSVFNVPARWLEIYEYEDNSRVIGSNPNLLNVDDVIAIPPCDVAADTPPPQIERATTPAPQQAGVFIPRIEVLTGGDYAPFTDRSAPGGGMLTQVVNAAFSASGLPNEYTVDFINDWGSHLTILLPKNKYDFGFPWFKPDCDRRDMLPDDMKIRCDYLWSDPLYTVSIAFYAPANLSDPPTDFAALEGKRICRPDGYYTFDLSENGLYDGRNVTLLRPSTVDGCFRALERGEVEYVSLNRFTAERAIAMAGLSEVVLPVETLVTTLTLHLVAHQDNHNAAYIWMTAFNQGLRAIQNNGTFGRITSYHLQKYREELAQIAQR